LFYQRLLCYFDAYKVMKGTSMKIFTAANAQNLSQAISEKFADDMLEFTDGMGVYKPSMQIDREEGRALEIQAIFRVPLQYGLQYGVSMTRVEMLAVLLEQV
jgi:2-dehydropantoate 2-reductase